MDENADRPFFNPTPDRKKKAGVYTLIWLTAIILVGVLLGNVLWLFAADVLAFGRGDDEVSVTVSETDSVADVAKQLKQKGLVHYGWLFRLYAKLTNASAQIRPGTYVLYTRYDYHAIVKALSAGTVSRSASIFEYTKEI